MGGGNIFFKSRPLAKYSNYLHLLRSGLIPKKQQQLQARHTIIQFMQYSCELVKAWLALASKALLIRATVFIELSFCEKNYDPGRSFSGTEMECPGSVELSFVSSGSCRALSTTATTSSSSSSSMAYVSPAVGDAVDVVVVAVANPSSVELTEVGTSSVADSFSLPMEKVGMLVEAGKVAVVVIACVMDCVGEKLERSSSVAV